MGKQISRRRTITVGVLGVIVASAAAIALHAVIPGGEVNAEDFDSVLVRALGFEVIASLYFLAVFGHCAVVTHGFGRMSAMPGTQIGLRFGLSFALLYLVGMQEIAVSASPFSQWGIDFVKYQISMGLSDATPALLLCLVIGALTLRKSGTKLPKGCGLGSIKTVVIIASAIMLVRIIGYLSGIIESELSIYPVQSVFWTALFGISIGFAYEYIRPVYADKDLLSVRLSVLTIGLNWIIFNIFIGLIFAGVMPQMFLRSGVDVAVLFTTTALLNKHTNWDA
jgi:hypothetical protein